MAADASAASLLGLSVAGCTEQRGAEETFQPQFCRTPFTPIYLGARSGGFSFPLDFFASHIQLRFDNLLERSGLVSAYLPCRPRAYRLT
jgi:hypothetical protein